MSEGYRDNGALFQKCHSALIKQTPAVQFVFENGNSIVKIPANKTVLAALSAVFNAMFNGELKETGDVKITDASPEAFQEFMQFFHGSQVKLTMENVAEVLKLADKYDVADCMPVCSDFLKKNVRINDVLWALQLAIQFDLDGLKTFCEQTIHRNHKTVFEQINFKNGQLREASDNRLSDMEMQNILPYVFAISKDIISCMSEVLSLTLVSANITTTSPVTNNEITQFTLNKTMLLTEIMCSEIATLNNNKRTRTDHAFEMTIAEQQTKLHTQTVTISCGGNVRASLKIEPPIRIEQNTLCSITFKSDENAKGLFTQKGIVALNTPIELSPGIHISFEPKNYTNSHSLISQLCFKIA